jgi:hypothetical protein
MSTKTKNDWTYANDAIEYNERIHLLMCELIARIDALTQRDVEHVSNVALIGIRNALMKYVHELINTH